MNLYEDRGQSMKKKIENKRTKKIVSWGLAILMLLTPGLAYVGDNAGSKAGSVQAKLSTQVTVDLLEKESLVESIEIGGKVYNYLSLPEANEPRTLKIGIDSLTLSLAAGAVTEENTVIEIGGNTETSEQEEATEEAAEAKTPSAIAVSGYDVGYILYKDGSLETPANVEPAENIVKKHSLSVNAGDRVAVYIKPKLSKEAGAVLSSMGVNVAYSLRGVYDIQKAECFDEDALGWYGDEGGLDSISKYVNEAYIRGANDAFDGVGRLRYTYLTSEEYKANSGDIDAYLYNNATWYDDRNIKFAPGISGRCYGYIGYCNDRGQYLGVKKKVGIVNVDTVEPVITDKSIQYMEGSYKDLELDKNKKGYVEEGKTYIYSFSLKDNSGGSGIDTAEIRIGRRAPGESEYTWSKKVDKRNGTYYFDLTSLDYGKSFAVMAVDRAGNETVCELGATLNTIPTGLRLEKAEWVTAAKSSAKKAKVTISDGEKYINAKTYIRLTISSDELVSSVYVKDGSNKKYASYSVNTGDNKKNKLTHRYETVQYIQVPKKTKTNNECSIGGITIKDNGGNILNVTEDSAAYGKFVGLYHFDRTTPVVSIKMGGAAFSKNKWYSSRQGNNVLTYSISPGTANEALESPFGSAGYTIYSAVDSNKTVKNIPFEDETGFVVPESKTAEGTVVAFEATDLASNQAKTKNSVFNIKVDNSAPAINLNSVRMYVSADRGKSWKRVSKNSAVNSVSSKYMYKYEISVKDELSGIKGVYCYTGIDPEEEPYGVCEEQDGRYVYYISNADVKAGTKLYINAVDMVGNRNDINYAFTDEVALNNNISISASLLDDNGKPVKYAELTTSAKTIRGYNLYVTAESAYHVKDIELVADGVTSGITRVTNSGVFGEDRSVTVSYRIPKDTDVSGITRSMYIRAEDGASPANEAVLSISDMLYEHILPSVTIETETELEQWHNSYNLEYALNVGDMAASGVMLSSASYSIDGKKTKLIASGKKEAEVKGAISNAELVESTGIEGTPIVFAAADQNGNQLSTKNGTVYVKIDRTSPKISGFCVNGLEDYSLKVKKSAEFKNPVIEADVSDNLTLDRVDMSISYPDGSVEKSSIDISHEDKDYSTTIRYDLPVSDGKKLVDDGEYMVELTAYDMAGNKSRTYETSFIVDNTAPVVTSKIVEGTAGGKVRNKKAGYDSYYSSDVKIRISSREENFYEGGADVFDNGVQIYPDWDTITDKRQIGYITVSEEGEHNIEIALTDEAGNKTRSNGFRFTVDKSAPRITTTLGGSVYNDALGEVNITGDAVLSVAVEDMTYDPGDLAMQVLLTKPGQSTVDTGYVKTENRVFNFSDEGDYVINLVAKDFAGNESPVNTVSFRIDKNAPQVSITGASGDTVSSESLNVSIGVQEAFWWDVQGTADIYRRAGDGAPETLIKQLDIKPLSAGYSYTELFDEAGSYRIDVKVVDKAGHETAANQQFVIDNAAPEILLSGIGNFDVTEDKVDFRAVVNEAFYIGKKVEVTGSRTDITGQSEKIEFTGVNASANPTNIEKLFTEDGIYDITIKASDAVGNTSEEKVHFTIDTTAPNIDGISDYDGKTIKSFDWKGDMEELVEDLTVCDVHMYLNGSEYDGTSAVADGSYVWTVSAEDELGHVTEKTASFILDTTPPTFIVTGVEDGEVKDESYSIGISMQLEEDTLTSVALNEKELTISENVCSFEVDSKDDYTLVLKAVDEAGNEAVRTISFTYGQKGIPWWIIVVVLVAAAGICAVAIGSRVKRK